jgi:hypothetical protein
MVLVAGSVAEYGAVAYNHGEAVDLTVVARGRDQALAGPLCAALFVSLNRWTS